MKKAISLFLVFSILLLSGNMYAKERKGADLILQKTDGQQARGELIAIKQNWLVLLEKDSGADVTVDIEDIDTITIVKKSKLLLGAGLGTLISGGSFSLYAASQSTFDFYDYWYTIVLAAAGGLVIGGIVGALVGMDKAIHIKGKSESEIQEILRKLRKKARVKNAM